MEILRLHVAGRPLLLAVVLTLVAAALLRRRAGARAAALASVAGALAALPAYVGIALWYATDPRYFDAAEPTIPIVGWLFTLGQPIYHEVDAATRYAHMYGPLAFIAPGLVLQAIGPGILASKALGVAAGLGSLALTWASLAAVTSRWRAVVLTGACALTCLAFRNYTFWTRPDPLLLLASAAGLLIVVRGRGIGAGVALGLVIGVLAGLKITGPLYALPLFVLLALRDGRAAAGAAAMAAVASALLPFAPANVSLPGYLAWVELSARNGVGFAPFRQNVNWAAFLLLPLAVAWLRPGGWHRPDRTVLLAGASLVAGLLAVAAAASKPGAGPYHLLPFVPLIACGIAAGLARQDAGTAHRLAAPVAVAWTVTLAAAAGAQQASFFVTLADGRAREELADLRTFLARNPGVVAQMADSRYDRPTFVRPILTFESGLYLIDPPAVQEHQLSGVPLPAATIDALRTCRAGVWLAPAGTEPFAGRNRYPATAHAPLFPDAFREAFQAAYARAERIGHYDVWRCRTRGGPPPRLLSRGRASPRRRRGWGSRRGRRAGCS